MAFVATDMLNRPGTRAALLALLLAAGGCRQDMREQPRLNPLTRSEFFADGSASRPLPANTVARGHLRTDTPYFTGKANGQFVQELPVPVTAELLHRGQERYGIYCTPCHDRAGTGQGIVVRRGYSPPRSYHEAQVKGQPVGYYFDVMTRGFGNMPDYAAVVPVADRWAIAAYIRVLQLSQDASFESLPAADKARLESPPAADTNAAPAAAEASGHGHS